MVDSDPSTSSNPSGVHDLLDLAVPGPLTFGPRAEAEHASGPAPKAGRVVDDFRLIEEIGQGGMGQVWRAEQLSLGRDVAIKFVRPERVTPRRLEYFEREARAGGRLSHAGLVAIHAYGESDGLAWIAMELVDRAWSLRDFLNDAKQRGELPANYDQEVARLVGEIARAMQAAHEAGVIHRDLKPQNVLVDKDGRVKVTDFGLARISGETGISQTGDVVGTYQYMSPEQVSGRQLDERSDVFSLGVLLYELLTLQRPFQGDTATQVAEQIRTRTPADPRNYRSKVGAELAVITLAALEKRPDDRYRSMSALADDLDRYRASEPVEARPPGRFGRAARWARRHPRRAASVFAGVLVLAAGALVLDRFRSLELSAAQAELLRADEFALQGIVDSERDLWPLHPKTLPHIDTWLEEAERLLGRRAEHEQAWEEFVGDELPDFAGAAAAIATSDLPRATRTGRTFERLDSVRRSLDELVERVRTVAARRARIGRLIERTIESRAAKKEWARASTAIRTSSVYGGLELSPQFGLLPIGPNEFGLWEFLHLTTGADDSADWSLGMTPDPARHGCVLVLVPGGSYWVGASNRAGDRNYDPECGGYELWPHEVVLEPFFLGKYEFTQGQWSHLTGERPSYHKVPDPWRQLPVEQVSWTTTRPVIGRVNLRLPNESEWESAARAGTSTAFPLPTNTPLSTYANVKDFDNIAPAEAAQFLAERPELVDEDVVVDTNGIQIHAFRDGHRNVAPVGSYTPNPFGFHDMAGNVVEWCLDRWQLYPNRELELPSNYNIESHQIMRGGGFHRSAYEARVSRRNGEIASFAYRALGFRAALSVE